MSAQPDSGATRGTGGAPADRAVVAGSTLEKGLAIAQFVAERGEVSAAQVVDAFGLSRSATYRLMDRLRASGHLQDGLAPGCYRLGPKMVAIGLAALNQLDLMHVAPPLIASLALRAGETVNLAVPDGDEMVYVFQQDGPGAVKVTARLGTRRPMNCTSLGKAVLAALPPAECEALLASMTYVRLTPRSLLTADDLRAEVDRTRERGYALDDLEVEDGVSCVGAAVLDARGRPVAAISVAGPAERMPGKRADVVPDLIATALSISSRLGYSA